MTLVPVDERYRSPPMMRALPCYSKLVAAPALEAIHLSNFSWLSIMTKPLDICEWPFPHNWAQLI
jgi:hypothetical protein